VVWLSSAVEKRFRLLGRDRGVAGDQRGEHATERLDPQRKRDHVQEEHVLDVTRQHAALDRRADRDHLVRVDAAVRVLAEEVLDHLLDLRDPGRAADQDHLVDLLRLQPRVLERLAHRRDGPLHQLVDQRLELGPRQRHVQVLRPLLRRGDEGEVDVRRHGGRQFHLRLFRRLLEALQRHGVLAQVDPLVLAELFHQPVDDPLVEVVAAQMGITVGRLDLEDALAQLQHGDVVGAAAQVVDGDLLVLLLVQPVRQRGRRRLVDDAKHLEPAILPASLVAWRCASLK
jgi:hypothetical protein